MVLREPTTINSAVTANRFRYDYNITEDLANWYRTRKANIKDYYFSPYKCGFDTIILYDTVLGLNAPKLDSSFFGGCRVVSSLDSVQIKS